MNNHEYSIYVEIAYQIFQKCFTVSAIDEKKRGWPKELSEAIQSEFPDQNHLETKALSDLYGRIKRLNAEQVTFAEMCISEKTLDLLSRFALITDYKSFNRNFKGIPALYSPVKFGLFHLLRIPADGILFKSKKSFSYQSDGEVIWETQSLKSMDLFYMPGDQFPHWLIVTYEAGGKEEKVYFAQLEPGNQQLVFAPTDTLTKFFKDGLKS